MAYGLTQSPLFVPANNQSLTANDSVSLSPTGDMTIEGWFYINNLPALNEQNELVSKTDFGTDRAFDFFLINLAGTQQVRMTLSSDGSSSTAAIFVQTLSTGVWQHLAMTYVAATHVVEFFVNGVSQGTFSAAIPTSIFNSTQVVTLGGFNTARFDGRQSLVRIWKGEARSGANILANMCNVLGSTTNLSAEWTLDNVLTDNSGNSNTLTNNGTVTFGVDTPATCSAVAGSASNLLLMGVGT